MDLYEILAEVESREMAFDHLLTIPEQDEWVYSDGKSTTCVAFILAMYKEAGIFGPISNSIQVTEFTVSHFALNLFSFAFKNAPCQYYYISSHSKSYYCTCSADS